MNRLREGDIEPPTGAEPRCASPGASPAECQSLDPSKVIVTLSGPDSEKGLLRDIVVQLGGQCVTKVFGRVPKPTHVIVNGTEVSAKILLARALGIPLLNRSWVDDIVSASRFIVPQRQHFHEYHLQGSQYEGLHDCTISSESHVARKRIHTSLNAHRAELIGTPKTPLASLLKDTWIYFVGESESPSNEQYEELVKLIGGEIARTLLKADVMIELDAGATLSKMTTDERRMVSEKSLVSGKWLIDSIMLGKRQPLADYELRHETLVHGHQATPMRTHVLEVASRSSYTPPHQRSGGNDSSSNSKTPIGGLNPLAKTTQGPSSAIKYAAQQPNTQQLSE